MTYEEKIKYLRQYKNIDRNINRLIEEQQHWRDLAEHITSNISDMPRAKNSDNPRETAICKVIDLEHEINAQIDDFVDLRRDIEAAINTVQKEKLQLILKYRYIDGMTVEAVAEAMDYELRWTKRLFKQAINSIKI